METEFRLLRTVDRKVFGEMGGDFFRRFPAFFSPPIAQFEMSDIENSLLSGWLKKKGDKGIIKGWKNRWFQVRFAKTLFFVFSSFRTSF